MFDRIDVLGLVAVLVMVLMWYHLGNPKDFHLSRLNVQGLGESDRAEFARMEHHSEDGI